MKKIKRAKIILLSLSFLSLFVAYNVHAQLVPCGIGEGNANCTLCHLVVGFKNIYDYLFEILLVCSTIVIVAAGIMYMVSSGSKGMIDKAKTAFTSALTAIILALVAWLIINATLHALGYKNAGNWWTFSCDTIQTKGPGTTGLGGQTIPTRTAAVNTAQGDGSCGGTKDIIEDKANCTRTSKALDDVLACIKGQTAFNSNEQKGKSLFADILNPFHAQPALAAGRMTASIGMDYSGHVTNSCHYGGRNCQGQANAADLHGDLPAIRDAAISCGANTVISNNMAYFAGQSKGASDHTKHVHISVNNGACGCDYLK